MLVDARPADGSIDDADRDLLALDQSPAEFHAPVADLALARIATAGDGVTPEFLAGVVGVASGAAEGANPVTGEGRIFGADVGGHGVGLAINEVHIAAHDIRGGVQYGLLVVGLGAKLGAVFDEAGFEFHDQRIGLLSGQLSDLGGVGFVIGEDPHEDGVRTFGECAGVGQRAMLFVAGDELVVLRLLVRGQRTIHPRLLARGRFRDGDQRRLSDLRPAVVDRDRDLHRTASLRPLQNQLARLHLLDDRHVVDGPGVVQLARPGRLHLLQIGDLRHDLDRLAPIPSGRGRELKHWLRDGLCDRYRDLDGLHFGRVDSFECQRELVISPLRTDRLEAYPTRDSPGMERERESVSSHHRLLPVPLENPIHLLSPTSLRSNSRGLPLLHHQLLTRNGELAPRLDHWPDQRLPRLLVLILQLNPIRRPRDLRDPHLIHVAHEVVIVIPPAQPHPRGGLDVEQRLRSPIELPVDVDATVLAVIGMDDVHPLAELEYPVAVHVREVTVDVQVRRAAELHADLAAASAAFVAPADNRGVGLLDTEPRFGAVRAISRGIVGNHVAAEDPFLSGEVPGHADHARCGGGPFVLAGEGADFVLHWIVHVPDADVAVGVVEYGLAA